MKVEPIPPIYEPSFGILQEYRKTPYGYYMKGKYKDYKIEIFNATKYDQKLQYVSHYTFLTWIKSKLSYVQDGVKKIVRSERWKI